VLLLGGPAGHMRDRATSYQSCLALPASHPDSMPALSTVNDTSCAPSYRPPAGWCEEACRRRR
jgi:hypothetical protein